MDGITFRLLPNELDFPEILGLRAPLPTLILDDEDDGLYTLPEMKQADKILNEIYTKANAGDHYKCSYYPGIRISLIRRCRKKPSTGLING